jgi:hypothetical protein
VIISRLDSTVDETVSRAELTGDPFDVTVSVIDWTARRVAIESTPGVAGGSSKSRRGVVDGQVARPPSVTQTRPRMRS